MGRREACENSLIDMYQVAHYIMGFLPKKVYRIDTDEELYR